MGRLYGADRRVLIGSRLFSSGPLSQKLQGFVWDFFTRRVPVLEPYYHTTIVILVILYCLTFAEGSKKGTPVKSATKMT